MKKRIGCIIFCLMFAFLLISPFAAMAATREFPTQTCLWSEPMETSSFDTGINIAFPDPGAAYWTTTVNIPEGATLQFTGTFPHSRYMSFNAYNWVNRAPVNALDDVEIIPDEGGDNPYLPDAKRNSDKESTYTVTVVNAVAPTDPGMLAPNTIYAGVEGQEVEELHLWYRVYVADKGFDMTGTEQYLYLRGLPTTAEAVCAQYEAVGMECPEPYATHAQILQDNNDLGGMSEIPLKFTKAFTVPYAVQCLYLGACGGEEVIPVELGQYSNEQCHYVFTSISREFGDVLVLRGKMPTYAETYNRVSKMPDGSEQMRYWSIITMEQMVTTRTSDGVYDEQVPLDDNDYYTIVISLPEDRPDNASLKKGVTWLKWPENGDALPEPYNHPNDGNIMIRNMMVSPSFDNAIQKATSPAVLEEVMGEYLPTGQYMSKEDFEALGDNPVERLQ
ncbi:MAG: hypothetical protein HF978_12640 [Desulfobacteraceae bacterium]|nr:hypothetical protein [Desulfobacteraceae bacterium]MBC2756386.1 hypothetical protein [Desulfobacteraceae bacterium]